jgi:tetratricopeptide (TPR) repeat protein
MLSTAMTLALLVTLGVNVDPPPSVLADVEKALALRQEGKQAEGVAVLEAAQSRQTQQQDPLGAAVASHRIGDLKHDLGDTLGADAAYQAALTVYERRQDWARAGVVCNDLALLYGQGDPRHVTWLQKAVGLRKRASDWAGARLSLNNLGTAQFYEHQWARADATWREALTLGERAQDTEGVMKELANLALLHSLWAEGGFPDETRPGVPEESDGDWPLAPVKCNDTHLAQARRFYAQGQAQAHLHQLDPGLICEAFGSYDNRCPRLEPDARCK